MKKGLRTIFCLILCLLITFSVSVYGGSDSDIGEGDKDVAKPCNPSVNGSLCWNHSLVSGNGADYLEAIRISIVHKDDGSRIPGTISLDFARNSTPTEKRAFSALRNRRMYQYSNKMTKTEALAAGAGYSHSTGYPIRDFGENYLFPPVFNKIGKNIKSYFIDLTSFNAPPEKKKFYKEKILKPLGYNLDAEPAQFSEEEILNHYLLIEPVIYVRVSKIGHWTKEFVGSATEVVQMMSHEPQGAGGDPVYDLFLGGTFKAKPGKPVFSHSSTRSHRFRRQIPTLIYVDLENQSIAGLTGIAHWVSDQNKNLSAEILTRNGTVAGHVWVMPKDCDNLEFAKANYKLCCKELYEKHYLRDQKVSIINYLKVGEYHCCEDLAQKVPGFKTGPLYEAHCKTPTPPSPCTYKFEAQCPENCFSTTEGFIKDIGEDNDMTDWNCIFESPKSVFPKVRNHYKWSGVDNRYCQAYCREEITYEFPGGGISVLAGQHFTIGGDYNRSDWSPIKFNGYMECRTKGNGNFKVINHKQFVIDWKKANEDVINTWNTYQTEKVRDISRGKAEKSREKDCDYRCPPGTSREIDGECCAKTEWDECYTGNPNHCPGAKDKDGKCKVPTINTCIEERVCVKDLDKIPYGYTMTPPEVTLGDYTAQEVTWCSTKPAPTSKVNQALSAYERAVEYRKELLNMIEWCNEWTRPYTEFTPTVELKFEEEEYGINFDDRPDGLLQANLNANNSTTTYYDGDTYDREKGYSEDEVDRADCDTAYRFCKTNEQKYPDNDNKKYEVFKAYTYTLNDDLYRYVSKPPGYSYSQIPGYGEYVDMGYANLPVHYSRREGRYELSLNYTSFGNNNKFNRYVFDRDAFPATTENFYYCSTYYECAYRVINDIITTKEVGLNVVFRPVSLKNPFPGENAPSGGRRRGENWASPSDVLKITKNRGLSDPERIYLDKDPMYEITLNTRSILSIRSYNRLAEGGYADFTLKCIEGTGQRCKSQFIREDYRHLFNSSLCGMSSDWDRCNKDDGI